MLPVTPPVVQLLEEGSSGQGQGQGQEETQVDVMRVPPLQPCMVKRPLAQPAQVVVPVAVVMVVVVATGRTAAPLSDEGLLTMARTQVRRRTVPTAWRSTT